ncbi:glycerol-3-phosphate cytidiltransferase [Aeromicrobium sp. PE09-221]|uniref:adenylyltransferase/cytidyltransferase family protein n=1 Tax=Aeromicrobium sp. PE09-221 TaxID=1898043 RepID=UPI000B3E8EC8|nr:glycerol-3-phosphate cytidiltransferase [Aeromicrobium sp. PE09-221]
MTTILTYGTFDLFHIGHVRLLSRLAELGDRLIVGVSTDEFNAAKGKRSFIPYEHRAEIVASMRSVDRVIPETSWEQKRADIILHGVDIFAIGSDWKGKFDTLSDLCEVRYLERTDGISSTELKAQLAAPEPQEIERLGHALDILQQVVDNYRGLP